MFKEKNDTSAILDYAILLGGLAITGMLIKALRLSQISIFVATIPLSLAYVLWGVLHHKRHGHLDKKIFFEYAGLALLINIIIFTLVV